MSTKKRTFRSTGFPLLDGREQHTKRQRRCNLAKNVINTVGMGIVKTHNAYNEALARQLDLIDAMFEATHETYHQIVEGPDDAHVAVFGTLDEFECHIKYMELKKENRSKMYHVLHHYQCPPDIGLTEFYCVIYPELRELGLTDSHPVFSLRTER